MSIAHHISDYLIDHDIDYHVYPHPYAETASEVAREAHVAPSRMAKAVVFVVKDGHRRKYRLAVLPATRDLSVHDLERWTHQKVSLAREYELALIFPDCALGAVPILGEAYGVPTVVDESFRHRQDDIFFEAGDHEEVIRVSADQFKRLMNTAEFLPICRATHRH